MQTAARSRSRQDVLRDSRTERIVDAAREVLGDLGWADAPIDRIANAAGVGRSTVHVYFDSKEAILRGCVQRGREQLVARVRAAVEESGDLEPRLAALAREVLAHVDANRRFFRVVTASEGYGPLDEDDPSPALAALRGDCEALLEALDWQWQNSGVREEHPEYDLLPSEYFRRQIYGCFWFERDGVRSALRLYPENLLYETDYSHPTCMAPSDYTPATHPREYAVEALADVPEPILQKVLHDNAAALYGLD